MSKKVIAMRDHQPKTPEQLRQEHHDRTTKPSIAEVRTWITAGCLATGEKVYNQIAEQHKDIFALQEKAFMAIVEKMHERLCALERAAGIEPGKLSTLQDMLDDILGEPQTETPTTGEVMAAPMPGEEPEEAAPRTPLTVQ